MRFPPRTRRRCHWQYCYLDWLEVDEFVDHPIEKCALIVNLISFQVVPSD